VIEALIEAVIGRRFAALLLAGACAMMAPASWSAEAGSAHADDRSAEVAPAIAHGYPYDGPSGGPTDRDALVARLAALAVYAADFTQEVYGSRGELLESSEGYVRLQRPSFKWVVEDPYPQTIITDGDRLKLYDPDLEQVTIRPLDEALQDTPVSLLTRDDVSLGEAFEIVRIAGAEGETYLIDPRSPDTLYRQIQLHFGPAGTGTLTGLDILDHLGQRTEIRFRPESGVASIPAGEFVLDVPPETDVIGG
jgi:outer membrane lipoprotein carrier protein